MSKYCAKCRNQISEEEKFCKQCGNAIAEQSGQNEQFNNVLVNRYEFITKKPTFRFMSAKITTTTSVMNNILSTSEKCKAKILSKKRLNGQINISDITSVTYKQYAVISLLDVFLFALSLILFFVGEMYCLACAVIVGLIWWRALVPAVEIKTKDNKKLSILFSPTDDGKKMLKLISRITGRNIDENSEIKIPFSKEPIIAAVIALAVSFILAVIFV